MSPAIFILIPALSCAIFALALIAGARSSWRQRHRSGAALRGLLAFTFGVAAIGLFALSASIRNYFALEQETTVATLSFERLAPQRFQAHITTADGVQRAFVLTGDEWQVDARVIVWRLPALLAGAAPLYRVERISGRYRSIAQEHEAERSVHALGDGTWPDLWLTKQRFPQRLPFVAAYYGSAAYLPMLDATTFVVTFSGRGGLVARAADAATQEKLDQAGW